MNLRTPGAIVALGALCLIGCGEHESGQPPAPTPTPDPVAALPVNQTVNLPGLGGTTDVVFDEHGIPHVFAPDTPSAELVQGYLTAAARFWEMDVFRRIGEGRLAEIFGRGALNQDVLMRTVFTTRDGRRLEEALWTYAQQVDPGLAQILTAYADGVNAWLADLRAGRNGATLPAEYTLAPLIDETPQTLADWRPQDTLSIARFQAYELSETLDDEIQLAMVMQSPLPPDVIQDVFRSAPATTTTVLPVSPSTPSHAARVERGAVPPALPPLQTLREISTALADAQQFNPFGTRARGAGSNNWIVSPALSANGHAMLANDPHLNLFNPPIWHIIQIDAGAGTDDATRASGVTFPGLPGILLGHNDFGAWGATVAGYDVTDIYVEQVTTPPDYPSSPRTVLFNGQQVPVLRLDETITVKNSTAVDAVIEVVPHHGPMVPDPSHPMAGLAGTNMSFRWTGHEITNDARFLLDLDRAHTVNDFRSALESFATGAQNWVWADIDGNIAYFPRALIPQRPAGSVPYLPMPGTGEAEWLTDAQGNTLWLPDASIPQATNPPAGFLVTANNDQIGVTLDNNPLNDKFYLAYSYDIGFRAQRIQEMLSNSANVRPSGTKITEADMSAYQYDHSSKEATRFLPFLFAAAANRPDLVSADMADALNRLQAWGKTQPGSPYVAASGVDPHDLRADIPPRPTPVTDAERADAVATSIFAAWETRLAPAVFGDDFAGTGIDPPTEGDATKSLLHILEDIDRPDTDSLRVYTKGANGESTLWDDKTTPQVETRDEILLGALRDGLTYLQSTFAAPQPEDWLWGMIHQVTFQHFLGESGIDILNLGPFAAPGARYTVNPADYDLVLNPSFQFSDGPSERFVAVLDPAGVHAVNALPGGENGNPGAAEMSIYNMINPDLHYGDLIPGWINGQTFDYYSSHADVAAHAVLKVRYTP